MSPTQPLPNINHCLHYSHRPCLVSMVTTLYCVKKYKKLKMWAFSVRTQTYFNSTRIHTLQRSRRKCGAEIITKTLASAVHRATLHPESALCFYSFRRQQVFVVSTLFVSQLHDLLIFWTE